MSHRASMPQLSPVGFGPLLEVLRNRPIGDNLAVAGPKADVAFPNTLTTCHSSIRIGIEGCDDRTNSRNCAFSERRPGCGAVARAADPRCRGVDGNRTPSAAAVGPRPDGGWCVSHGSAPGLWGRRIGPDGAGAGGGRTLALQRLGR